MIKNILFDLDGTLLPMDMDRFTTAYFKQLVKKVAPLGYDGEQLIAGIWAGTAAMVKNDGSCTNEEAFWKKFTALFGEKAERDRCVFEEFYRESVLRLYRKSRLYGENAQRKRLFAGACHQPAFSRRCHAKPCELGGTFGG